MRSVDERNEWQTQQQLWCKKELFEPLCFCRVRCLSWKKLNRTCHEKGMSLPIVRSHEDLRLLMESTIFLDKMTTHSMIMLDMVEYSSYSWFFSVQWLLSCFIWHGLLSSYHTYWTIHMNQIHMIFSAVSQGFQFPFALVIGTQQCMW